MFLILYQFLKIHTFSIEREQNLGQISFISYWLHYISWFTYFEFNIRFCKERNEKNPYPIFGKVIKIIIEPFPSMGPYRYERWLNLFF